MSANPRVSKTINNQTTYFIYDGYKLIGEYKQDGEPIKEYLYLNNTPIAIITPTETYKIYADHLNTPRRVATQDNTIIWSWESKPFGESKPDEDVDGDGKIFTLNLRFPGQYFDKETNKHYNINRDYDPVTGRYIQSDPIGFEGGINTYLYVGANPVVRVDESGKFLIFAGGSIVGTIPGIFIGGNGGGGFFYDYNKDKVGWYYYRGGSVGVDLSLGVAAGVIYGDDSFDKFRGKSWSSNVGFLIFTATVIYDMDNNWIGNAVGVDGGPLPASATIDFSYTVAKYYKTENVRKKIIKRLWDIYDSMLSWL